MDLVEIFKGLWQNVSANFGFTTVIVAIMTWVIGSGVFAFTRRLKTQHELFTGLFQETRLLTPPAARPAYSDRTAYLLAELSELAYCEFESTGGAILDAAKHLEQIQPAGFDQLKDFLDGFTNDIINKRSLSISFLEALLAGSDFKLIDTVNIEGVQAIACRRVKEGEQPYVVIAFRGTDKNPSEWLTGVSALPKVQGETKVHTGFYEAFHVNKAEGGITVKEKVQQIMDSADAKDENGEPLPLYITGHSLGGALALMATQALAKDINGACYTFGAPRIANYEFFAKLKTPVYRIVNSSDVLPRVPPGAIMAVLVNLIRLLAWLTTFAPPVSSLFRKLEVMLDKLNGYRHFGDMRYLTDIASGRFDDVELLPNPPAVDRIQWAWKHLARSIRLPLSSHSMSLYRKKLRQIAMSRN
jgi:triacylglycerol lipase